VKVFYTVTVDVEQRQSAMERKRGYQPEYRIVDRLTEYCCKEMEEFWEDRNPNIELNDNLPDLRWEIDWGEGSWRIDMKFCPFCGAKIEMVLKGTYERTWIKKPKTVMDSQPVDKLIE
jgi:hypothetical protein